MILGKIPPAKLPLDGRKPQNFSEWLEVATWYLVPSAQKRVRPEIETHYAEAVQTHLARGASQSSAQAAAFADLGDAKIAARRLNQQHLTTWEINALKKQITNARSSIPAISEWVILLCAFMISLMCIAFGFLGLFTNMRDFYLLTAPTLTSYLAFASFNLVAIVLARRKPTLALARQFSLIGTIKSNAVMLMMIAVNANILIGRAPLPFPDSSYFSYLIKIFFGVAIVAIFMSTIREGQKDSRLRKKLAAATEDDLPPPDSSTA